MLPRTLNTARSPDRKRATGDELGLCLLCLFLCFPFLFFLFSFSSLFYGSTVYLFSQSVSHYHTPTVAGSSWTTHTLLFFYFYGSSVLRNKLWRAPSHERKLNTGRAGFGGETSWVHSAHLPPSANKLSQLKSSGALHVSTTVTPVRVTRYSSCAGH